MKIVTWLSFKRFFEQLTPSVLFTTIMGPSEKVRTLTLVVCMSSVLSVVRAQTIYYSVQEGQPPPVELGNVRESANISASITDLSFSLFSSENKDMFKIDSRTGVLQTNTILDREVLCGAEPRCIQNTKVVISSPELNEPMQYEIKITVDDTNDERPYWSVPFYSTTISERAAVNTTIKLPLAVDDDSEPMFKVQRYALEPRDSSPFGLVVQQSKRPNGHIDFELSLRLKRKIDRERQGVHNLTLVAHDGDGPNHKATLSLTIYVGDENDNAPAFDVPRYVRRVADVAPPGSSILKVSATDDDEGENARISYSLPNNINARVLELLRLDPTTGELKLNQSLGKETSLVFRVRASDHGNPVQFSEVEVSIDVQDTLNDPPRMVIARDRFNETFDFVREDASINKVVVSVDVFDNDGGDNGKVDCSVTDEYFQLRRVSSTADSYMLVVGKELDRETKDRHSLTVTCTDHGSPALSSSEVINILVLDVNEFAPEFTKAVYRMSVKENQQKDVLVGNVYASDKDDGVNGEVSYSLPPDVLEFDINAKGFIYTAVRNLDRESKDVYKFEVYAYDMAIPPRTSTASVIVAIEDLNDQWPKFDSSSYHFEISESARNGTVVGKFHASDLDAGKGGVVEYVLVHAPRHPDPPFSLSQVSGSMTLIRALDFEEEDQYRFVVTAIDLGDPPRSSTVEVIIDLLDENDNSPVITFPSSDNLSVTLNLDVIPGHEIIQVIAHDADSGTNGKLSYNMIAAPNTSSDDAVSRLFWMNEDTGLVTLVAPLTPADVRSYNIVVSVQDQGLRLQRASRAVLVVQVVQESGFGAGSHRESYTTIVIAMVCVTLLVAVVVLLILCYIKYSDRRRYHKNKNVIDHSHLHHDHHQHQHADHQLHHKAAVFDSAPTKYDVFTLENGGSVDEHDGGGDRSADPLDPTMSPSLQKQPLTLQHHHRRMGSSSRPGKKSVTFDSEVRSSDTSASPCGSTSNVLQDLPPLERERGSSVSPAPFSYFPPTAVSLSGGRNYSPSPAASSAPNLNLTHNPKLTHHAYANKSASVSFNPDSQTRPAGWINNSSSSFRPGPSSSPSPHSSAAAAAPAPPPYSAVNPQQGLGDRVNQQGGDEVVGVALQKHNALVRSMRGNTRRPPGATGQARRTSGEADICSSSSVETNDSGHGGSELDVSVIKANV